MAVQRILGIDPGSHKMGVGCLEKSGNRYQIICAEVLAAPAKAPLYERLECIREKFETILSTTQPTAIAVEEAFHHRNARSALVLGVARGVVLSSCLRAGLKIFEYAPTQVKAVVTGYGRAEKDQVQKMLSLILGVKLNLGLDASDALAVALCHASQNLFLGKQCSDLSAEKSFPRV